MNPIRVLVVDDHDLVRAGLRALLEKIPGVEVIGEATNGREALHQIEALAPNIVLMDLMMPVMNGVEATPAAKVVRDVLAHADRAVGIARTESAVVDDLVVAVDRNHRGVGLGGQRDRQHHRRRDDFACPATEPTAAEPE